ncbi:DMT family transporter [Pseudobacteriovorax antillogorgiicola]|nr:DMT family transporter [Pseudobacteriovorax antillogorgiicola]
MGSRFSVSLVYVYGLSLLGALCLARFELDYFNYGDLCALGSALLYGFYTVSIEKYSRQIKPSFLLSWQASFWFFFSLVMFLFDYSNHVAVKNLDSKFIGYIVIWSILTFFVYWLQNRVQQQVKASTLGFIMILDTPLAVLLALMIFKEQPIFIEILGAFIILLAVSLAPRLIRESNLQELASSCMKKNVTTKLSAKNI